MKRQIALADTYVPQWRRYAFAASYGTVGALAANVPGALIGGYYGYKAGKRSEISLPKRRKIMDSGYGSGKRKYASGSTPGLRKRYKTPAYVAKGKKGAVLSRAAFLARIGKQSGPGGRAVPIRPPRRTRRTGKKPYTGPYQGKLPKGRKVKHNIESLCLSQGYVKKVEQYGVIRDPDCVYINHSTGYLNEIARTFAVALLRKAMTKAGFKITNQHQELAITAPIAGLNASENSEGIRFVYTTKDTITGAYNNIIYDTVDNQSFIKMVQNWPQFPNHIIDYIRNVNASEPFKLSVYKRDFGAISTFWNLGAEMYLTDCKMQLFIQSTLTIQNRTAAANTTGEDQLDANRVDNQPLKGWLYDFKNADMRVRHQGPLNAFDPDTQNSFFNRSQDNGLSLIGGAEFANNYAVTAQITETTGATEPFVPKYFANISKATPIMIQPGEVRKTSFNYKYSGKITNILKTMKVVFWDGVNTAFTGMRGKCQMIALEEMMRTQSSNRVTIAYEREMTIGCIVKPALLQAPLEAAIIHQNIDRGL